MQTIAFQFGRQLGMAFQLVDDLLDFIATSAQLGKPAAADLRLGLATAPVLFAAQKVIPAQIIKTATFFSKRSFYYFFTVS